MAASLHLGFVEVYDKTPSRVTVLDRATLREICHAPLRLKPRWRRSGAGGLVDAVLESFPSVSEVVLVESDAAAPAPPRRRREPRVPLYVASRSATLARAVPKTFERFVLIDFAGSGTLSLVSRGNVACTAPRVRSHESSLCKILQVDDLAAFAQEGAQSAQERVARMLSASLRVARDFGYRSVAIAPSEQVDVALARRLAVCVERLAGDTCPPVAVLTQDVIRRGTIAAIAPDREQPVHRSVCGDAVSLSMRAARDISYSVIQLGAPVFDEHTPALSELLGQRPVLIAVDERVDALYGVQLRAYAARHLNLSNVVSLTAGEAHKDLRQVERICRAAIAAGLPRDGAIVGVGGGVVLDIAGTAAALYRRGVAFVRIPTTLLGMVDVAVGIKQGVNFGRHKNLLGTFYAPLGVLNDLAFLRTAPPRELACGVAEIIKIAVAADAALFDLLERHLDELMRSAFQQPGAIAREVIERAASVMMVELAPNLYEDDLKRAVDFGHSFSPTLESRTDYRLLHGEAVAIDMLISTAIAVRRGLCSSTLFERMLRLYGAAGLRSFDESCTVKLLLRALDDVKAHRGGRLNFPIPKRLGECAFLQEVGADDVRAALAAVASASTIRSRAAS